MIRQTARRLALAAVVLAASGRTASAAPVDLATLAARVDRDRIERDIRELAAFGTRHTLSDTAGASRGIGAARRRVYDMFREVARTSGGRMTVAYDEFTPDSSARVPAPVSMRNVTAVLRGERPSSRDRYFVVGGHLDSRASDVMDAASDAPGANDDASGVAVVLEAARVLSGVPLDASIVFVAFTGEEQGLLGSGHWAETAKANGMNVAGMITNDIVGNSTGGNGIANSGMVRLFSEGISAAETDTEARIRAAIGGENDGISRQLARRIRAIAGPAVPGFEVHLVARRDRFLRGGDHIPFNRAGYAAVRFTEPAEDYRRQHQDVRTENSVAYGDVAGAVDFDYAARVARVNVAALAGLALAPGVPENVVVLTKELTNATTLRWTAPPDDDTAGYRIVWRDTMSPDWEHSVDVGNVTTYTFPALSKDDWIFGVQAVDRDGNASPAAYPQPSRD